LAAVISDPVTTEIGCNFSPAQSLGGSSSSSFFLFSPALRAYMIGPMRSPDIQNLLEAFTSIKREKSLRGLCKPKERSPME